MSSSTIWRNPGCCFIQYGTNTKWSDLEFEIFFKNSEIQSSEVPSSTIWRNPGCSLYIMVGWKPFCAGPDHYHYVRFILSRIYWIIIIWIIDEQYMMKQILYIYDLNTTVTIHHDMILIPRMPTRLFRVRVPWIAWPKLGKAEVCEPPDFPGRHSRQTMRKRMNSSTSHHLGGS